MCPNYSRNLHIVASVRAPCPTCSRPSLSRTYVKRAVHATTCSQPPCLVRMLNEPFTQRAPGPPAGRTPAALGDGRVGTLGCGSSCGRGPRTT
eukprot:2830356-Prymnesium_polylepis.1